MEDNIEKNDVAEQYDHYYVGKSHSLYNKRFGTNRFIPREKSVIKNLFTRTHKNFLSKNLIQSYFKILDFGCGNGRIFPIVENIVNKDKRRKIELIAYDISLVGLHEFIDQLENKGYKKQQEIIKEKKDSSRNKGIILGCWSKDSLRIKVIYGNVNDSGAYIESLIEGPVHCILCIFTVLGHVPGRSNRQRILKSFERILDSKGEVIINVSTTASLLEEATTYKVIRHQYKVASIYGMNKKAEFLEQILGEATEPGDLYFTKDDGVNATFMYGHVYSGDELIEDTKEAGFVTRYIKVMSIEQPFILSKNKIKKWFDTLLSMLLSINLSFYPFSSFDHIAKNIFIIVKKK